jgi:hypothetical protein
MPNSCSLEDSVQNILETLPERKAKILALRFGLKNMKINTLNEIGLKFKITRERVRQIEKESFDFILKKELPSCIKSFNKAIKNIIKKNNSFIEEERLVKLVQEEYGINNVNIIRFLLHLNNEIYFSRNNFNFKQFWVLDKNKIKELKKLLFLIEDCFKQEQKLLSLNEIKNILNFSGKTNELKDVICLDKKIDQNVQGLYGFYKWPIINPLSAKDRAYYLLKFQEKKPVHFKDIASKLTQCNFNRKNKKHIVGVQTVHNELIKDNRFVLVGHGNYALKEWGYEEGVVRDIIKYVLVKNGSMSEEDIIREVQKQRMVRPSTVKLNLHNKNLFKKNTNGGYELLDNSNGVLNA